MKTNKYRINGFEQLERFYSIVFSGEFELTPHHISLYMFLFNQNNRNGWHEWFKCPLDLAVNGSQIGSKHTYYKVLKDLQNFGLIEYEKGINDYKAPKIKLTKLNSKNAPLNAPQCEPLPTPLPTPLLHPLYNYITNNLFNLITINKKKLEKEKCFLKMEFESDKENLKNAISLGLNKVEWNELDNESKKEFLELIKAEFKTANEWYNSVARIKHITISETETQFSCFLKDLILKDDYYKGIKKIKEHFVSWINISIEKGKIKIR